ncbi:TetR/AcrR family transcriptional regulator [Planococcus sp. YIM B11945]|uniref:TetR/AcrR family transcriptional regulator n=1 Tax=Planococcus sp. YIM B11945 TaxID=3435410 RepID=UPI003D7DE933
MNSKKQQIVNAAYSLFINKGYNASSIQDILNESGVSKGTFYNYFTSKTECLIAIMESIGSEIRQKRMAAAAGKPIEDLNVLAEQLCIRIRLNREKNLFALYESIFYSQDEELKKFSRSTYVAEMEWISSRITDVFGEKAKPYALENAAIVHGSIQQLTHIWKLNSSQDLPTQKLAAFVIRRLEAAITTQIETGDHFLGEMNFSSIKPLESITPAELSDQLKESAHLLDEEEEAVIKELIGFVAEELASVTPRRILIESALSTITTHQIHEPKLLILLEQVWKQLQKL